MKFIFELDGAVTIQETLSLIIKHFGVEEESANLTEEETQGNVPFIESFIRRVNILGKLPVTDVANVLEQAALYSNVCKFIKAHEKECVIVTSNLDCWIEKLVNRVNCKYYASKASVEDNRVVSIARILNKEQVIKKYKDLGEKVIFIGSGNNDLEAMRIADVAIATGLMHHSANGIMSFTDYLIFDEKALCRQLNQLF